MTDCCSECGEHWDCATFLSETFNYNGGNMVFQCQCGNTKTRMFLPTDIMPIEEVVKYVMKQEGIDESVIESAVSNYKAQQALKKKLGLPYKIPESYTLKAQLDYGCKKDELVKIQISQKVE